MEELKDLQSLDHHRDVASLDPLPLHCRNVCEEGGDEDARIYLAGAREGRDLGVASVKIDEDHPC